MDKKTHYEFAKALGIQAGTITQVEIATEEEAKELQKNGIACTKYTYNSINYGFYEKYPEKKYSDDQLEILAKIKLLKDVKVIKYCAIAVTVVVVVGIIASMISLGNIANTIKSFVGGFGRLF